MNNPTRDPQQTGPYRMEGPLLRCPIEKSRFKNTDAADRPGGERVEIALERARPSSPATEVRSNRSVDHIDHPLAGLPFDQSINPYRVASNGCVYCYARPSHPISLSQGLDFETKIFAKTNARRTASEGTESEPMRLDDDPPGANTDPYQPTERQLQITRIVAGVLRVRTHPSASLTKSSR